MKAIILTVAFLTGLYLTVGSAILEQGKSNAAAQAERVNMLEGI